LASLLSLGEGELAEEVFIDVTEDVLGVEADGFAVIRGAGEVCV